MDKEKWGKYTSFGYICVCMYDNFAKEPTVGWKTEQISGVIRKKLCFIKKERLCHKY